MQLTKGLTWKKRSPSGALTFLNYLSGIARIDFLEFTPSDLSLNLDV